MKTKLAACEYRGERLQALTLRQARLVDAIAARIFPTTDTPGAVEAGAVFYIDRALAGPYASWLPRYIRGFRALNRYSKRQFGASFERLSGEQQDSVLSDLEAGKLIELRNGREFFEALRAHVLEGVFGEPSYGGNREMIGWRLVGFPGQQWGYPETYINKVVDLPPDLGRIAEEARGAMSRSIADVCIVGVGAVGGILAKQLTSAGLKVVALERGPALKTAEYAQRDSISYIARPEQLEGARHEPRIFRSSATQAGRVRYGTSPFNVLGGSMLLWTGQASRFMPGDFKVYSNEVASGVADRAGIDLSDYEVLDWPIGYDDLEPYYERFEWEFGVAGVAGMNPFAGLRRKPYPLPPLKMTARMQLFGEAAKRLGYHPFVGPAAVTSEPYRPPAPYDTRIPERPACVYCGHCNHYGCHVHAKASSLHAAIPVALQTGNLDLRTNCKVASLVTDDRGLITGVKYFDPNGALQEQRARVVILSAFVFEHVRLLLLSKGDSKRFKNGLANSSGLVGKCFFGHGDMRVYGLFDDFIINGFIGSGAAAMRIDDFNGNNFDHTGLGFIRGGTVGCSGDGAPVSRMDIVPPDQRSWGKGYKEYFMRYYTRSFDIHMAPETLPRRDNCIDLDPRRRDHWGLPLPRVTFAFHENEQRMHLFLAGIGEQILREAGASKVWTELPGPAPTRQCGGTRMGTDPKNSVVNGYCQSHDVPNLFIVGSSVFPTMSGYPATATIAALAYRTAEHIQQQSDWFR